MMAHCEISSTLIVGDIRLASFACAYSQLHMRVRKHMRTHSSGYSAR